MKYLNGECFVIRRGYKTARPVSSSFYLTVPGSNIPTLRAMIIIQQSDAGWQRWLAYLCDCELPRPISRRAATPEVATIWLKTAVPSPIVTTARHPTAKASKRAAITRTNNAPVQGLIAMLAINATASRVEVSVAISFKLGPCEVATTAVCVLLNLADLIPTACATKY